MIIVTGEVMASPDTIDELRAVCIAHSRRSRAEPGCLSHDLYVDGENALRLFFFERWADRAALDAHFQVPEANAFMRTVRGLSVGGSKGPQIFEVVPSP
ncbi:MAG: putative quinol monooxygenase [Caulobacter sp.]|nr:putative quinol monooxygenase [Caulobacter sp.]